MNDNDLYLALYIRKIEEGLLGLFSEGMLHGTVHTCIGQEMVPVSLRPLINEKDQIISNHRGHGHVIAFTGESEAFLSEIMSREGAACGGFGGSQHLSIGNVMTTGVQGEGPAMGLGFAWARKERADNSLAIVFVGDGTFGRGSVYESLNMAAIFNLPYVLVVENNHIAMTTAESDHMSGSIKARAEAFGVDYCRISSSDPDEIRAVISSPLNAVREGGSPLVIEFDTNRLASHSKGDDSRTDEEIAAVKESDWYRKYLESNGSDIDYIYEIETRAAEDAKSIINLVKGKKGMCNE